MASTKRKPTGTSATAMETSPACVNRPSSGSVKSKATGSGAAHGITAPTHSAGMNDMHGARKKRARFAVRGSVSSFRMFLMPSAMGCSQPPGPTRLGPRRFCIHAETFRSMNVM
jgi:hypothetical protein